MSLLEGSNSNEEVVDVDFFIQTTDRLKSVGIVAEHCIFDVDYNDCQFIVWNDFEKVIL